MGETEPSLGEGRMWKGTDGAFLTELTVENGLSTKLIHSRLLQVEEVFPSSV